MEGKAEKLTGSGLTISVKSDGGMVKATRLAEDQAPLLPLEGELELKEEGKSDLQRFMDDVLREIGNYGRTPGKRLSAREAARVAMRNYRG